MFKKIGIFSGTFDPIHEGHVSFAREALQRLQLDKIFFLVEPRPRRKQGVKDFEHRVNMAKLALDGEERMGLIILRQARFTPHETLPVLQARFVGAKLYMLMGEDMLDHLASWPHVSELVNQVHFVIGRRQKSVQDLNHLLDTLHQTRGLKFNCTLFKAKNAVVSSSQARTALRRGKKSVGVNPSVLHYIKKHHLYTAADD